MNRTNLTILADYLDKLPDDYEDFNMAVFYQGDREVEYACTRELCGTAACAVGHGPAAGIEVPRDLISFEYGEVMWTSYCLEAFGVSMLGPLGEWMFGAPWVDVDNTPKGAAKRIRYALANDGPPAGFSRRSKYEDYLHEYR